MKLERILALEQTTFLRRDRREWMEHLGKARSFLGQGLAETQPGMPALLLGAGTGLEIPWRLAPKGTVGWDADPLSRARTFLRHGRWVPWVFSDLTGAFDDLALLAKRCRVQSWSERVRPASMAALRLAGLLPSLKPKAEPLRTWIHEHRPSVILAANVMGQFGDLAQRIVEQAFKPMNPWVEDPDEPDPLAQALDAWTARCIRAFLDALQDSGAALWMLHDRGVLQGEGPFSLGPLQEPWAAQLRFSGASIHAIDPLCGVDVLWETRKRKVRGHERWLWPLGPGQVHLMEALALFPADPCG